MKHLRRVSALFVLLMALVVTPARPAKAIAPAAADFLNPDGTLRMEALEDGTLDLRGWDVNFDSRRGPVFRPAALNGTWSTLGGGVNNNVFAITVSGSNIYIGGWFTNAGGNPNADYIAVWDGSTWSALGSGLNGEVFVITVSGSNLYVGGNFTNAGGIAANRIAVWDGTTSSWSALGSGLNGLVRAIAVSGPNVYVGGSFTTAGGISANHIALWNSLSNVWSALGSGLNGEVLAVAVSGSNIYIGGNFINAGGNPNADYIAVWNGSAWSALGSGLNAEVFSIAIDGPNVYVGGSFTLASGTTANRIAVWNGSAWSALGSGLNGPVYVIAINGSNIYVGGSISTAGGNPANRIAVWNGSTWSALGSGMNSSVYAIAFNSSNVDVGGNFTNAGGIAANHIARFLVDATPPTVVFGAGSVPPSNGANLTIGPSQLVVHFSENVLSNGSQHAANSLWNYMLLRPGPNGIFDTPISTLPPGIDPICDSDHVREGDDERVDLFGATYDAANFTATITIDPFFAPLANGTYRLYVCGAASVDDLAGNQLNGGANTAVNFTVGAGAVVPAAQANSGKRRSTLPGTGFAPNQITLLGPQTIPYSELGDLWLEVPKLGLKMPIVGVPKTNDQWDVSWLGSSAGWLEGSAYPSWKGNSVITGHVWNADNTPGPFADLNKLWWGDKVSVHVSGQQYSYEIRSVKQVAPTDVEVMMKHEELPWLTLVSCKGYDEKAGAYRYRILVRAVLVEVK